MNLEKELKKANAALSKQRDSNAVLRNELKVIKMAHRQEIANLQATNGKLVVQLSNLRNKLRQIIKLIEE